MSKRRFFPDSVHSNLQNRLIAVLGDPSASFNVAAFASGLSLGHPEFFFLKKIIVF